MTQKQALKSLEDYCKVNNMHLTSSSFTRNAYAIVAHVEKPLNFDPFGHAELSLFAKI